MTDGIDSKPIYRRVLLKLSGEALQGEQLEGIDSQKIARIAQEIISLTHLQVQVAVVIGGGNIVRGSELSAGGVDRITADQMGMLSTLINALALRDGLEKKAQSAVIMSALPVSGIASACDRFVAQEKLTEHRVVIFAAGTGNPLVTTDTAAALRAIEISADVVIKATKVDGVFSADPIKNTQAERYQSISYDDVFTRRLAIMDLAAILLCQEHGVPIRVLNMNKSGALRRAVCGEDVGTLIRS